MAIRKQTDLGDGTSGDYWAMSGVPTTRRVGAKLEVQGEFCLWLNEASWSAGLRALPKRLRRIDAVLDTLDPTLSEVSAALEAVLLKKTVVGVKFRALKAAVPEILAKEAIDGVQARVEYQAPEDEVPEQLYVKAERGGLLEGGTRF